MVQHVLSLTEVGTVALQQQRGLAADGMAPCLSAEETAAAAAAAAIPRAGLPVGQLLPGIAGETAEDGVLLFRSSSSSSGYLGRPMATAEAFGGEKRGPEGAFFRSVLRGSIDASGEVRVLGCIYTAEPELQRPLYQRLQQWQWGLPRMERLIEGYVHKVPITGREWGNYHAKKRHWKRIF